MFGNGNKPNNGQRFTGPWRAITARCCMDFRIDKKSPDPDDDVYLLVCNDRTLTMIYNPETRLLENMKGEPPRRIAFWERESEDKKNCIFAMRRKPGTYPLLPFEHQDDDGAWGAEQG